jgi:hypothetical protein
MGGWGKAARRLASAGALALALLAVGVVAPDPDRGGWGQPGPPQFGFDYAPPPGGLAAAGPVPARPWGLAAARPVPARPGGLAAAGRGPGRRPAGWWPAWVPGGELAPPGPGGALLGVIGYKPAVLARLDPWTLRPLPGPRVRLRYGISSHGWSPDRSLLVLGDVDDDAVHLIDPVRLRRLATVRFGMVAQAPQQLAWLGPRRLAVVAGSSSDGSTLVMVDPVARRVLSRRPLGPAGVTMAAAGDRLVLLRSPLERIGPAQLQVVDDRGRIRTVELDGTQAGFQNPPDWDRPGAHGVTRDAALAVDPEGGRAFVAPAGAMVAEVDLASLRVAYRHLRQPTSLLRRLAHWLVPPAEAKLVSGTRRAACWLGQGSLAVWGTDMSVTGTTPAEQRVDQRPSGLKLVDTRSWTVRPLDPAATAASWQAGRLLAFGETWDFQAERARGMGVTLYGPGDRPRRLLGTQAVVEAHLDGDLLYAAVDTGKEQYGRAVVSLGTGRVMASSDAPLPFLLLGEGGPSC